MTLSWSEPGSLGHRPVTKYQVRHRQGDEADSAFSAWADVADSDTDGDLADEREATVAGLVAGTSYVFEVRAVNALGDGTGARLSATPQ